MKDDEGIKVFRRSEGIYFEARVDGVQVVDTCRKAGISQATYIEPLRS